MALGLEFNLIPTSGSTEGGEDGNHHNAQKSVIDALTPVRVVELGFMLTAIAAAQPRWIGALKALTMLEILPEKRLLSLYHITVLFFLRLP